MVPADTAAARLRHRFQRAALVLHVPLHRLHQVRNQVVPPLQLHVYLAPGIANLLAQHDEPVVNGDPPDGDDH
jgi:hypothetical protein